MNSTNEEGVAPQSFTRFRAKHIPDQSQWNYTANIEEQFRKGALEYLETRMAYPIAINEFDANIVIPETCFGSFWSDDYDLVPFGGTPLKVFLFECVTEATMFKMLHG